jgi:alpha-tubulin suppressor-like RCC1 family protein
MNSTSVSFPLQKHPFLSGKNITKLIVGYYSAMAQDVYGNVYVWGQNTRGVLGLNSTENPSFPVVNPLLFNASFIGLGVNPTSPNAFIIKDNVGYAMGSNSYGELDLGDTFDRPVPTVIPMVNPIAFFSMSGTTYIINRCNGSYSGVMCENPVNPIVFVAGTVNALHQTCVNASCLHLETSANLMFTTISLQKRFVNGLIRILGSL